MQTYIPNAILTAQIMLVCFSLLSLSSCSSSVPWYREYHLRSAEDCRLLSRSQKQSHTLKKALATALKAVDHAEKLADFHLGIALLDKAKLEEALGIYGAAAQTCKRAIKSIQRQISGLSPGQERSLLNRDLAAAFAALASAENLEQKPEQAAIDYGRSVEIYLSDPELKTNCLLRIEAIPVLEKLGQVFTALQRFEQSAKCYRQALKLAELGELSADKTRGLRGLLKPLVQGQELRDLEAEDKFEQQSKNAGLAFSEHQYALAEDGFMKASQMGTALSDSQRISLYRKLGQCRLKQGKLVPARESFETALVFCKNNDSKQEQEIIISGLLDCQSDALSRERLLLQQAQLRSHLFGQNSEQLANTSTLLARLYSAQGKEKLSEPFENTAFQFYKSSKLRRKDAPAAAELGKLFVRKGDYKKAGLMFIQSLKFYQSKKKDLLAGVASLQGELADLYRTTGDKHNEEKSLENLDRIVSSSDDKTRVWVADALIDLAERHYEKRDRAGVIFWINKVDRCLEITSREYPKFLSAEKRCQELKQRIRVLNTTQ